MYPNHILYKVKLSPSARHDDVSHDAHAMFCSPTPPGSEQGLFLISPSHSVASIAVYHPVAEVVVSACPWVTCCRILTPARENSTKPPPSQNKFVSISSTMRLYFQHISTTPHLNHHKYSSQLEYIK